jgi:hypothetical protein
MSRIGILCGIAAAAALVASGAAFGQGGVEELLAGKLVKPEVGQWSWYTLSDVKSGRTYLLRQAVVGKEKVGMKTAHWVEFEVVPRVGFKTVYKMLMTGPATNPKNIHRAILKSGEDPAVELPVPKDAKPAPRAKRKSLGKEPVQTGMGIVEAEHFEVRSPSGDGPPKEIWVSERIHPSGIVRLLSPNGEMSLRSHGTGGEYGESVIKETPVKLEDIGKKPRTLAPEGSEERQP